jgi:hypothetical protein
VPNQALATDALLGQCLALMRAISVRQVEGQNGVR